MNRYVRLWKSLGTSVKENINEMTPTKLCLSLLEWANHLKQDKNHQHLYFSYIEYYSKLDLNAYTYSIYWYSFSELIEYSLFRDSSNSLESLVLECRDVLNEMIVFKSDRHCKLLGEDDLRVFTSTDYSEIYFCCDGCLYVENMEGTKITISFPIIPATSNQIAKYNIKPSGYDI